MPKLLNPKDPSWVKRALDSNSPVLKDKDGEHKILSTSREYKGKEILFPLIRMKMGRLIKLDEDDAYRESIRRKDFISFDSPAEATKYSKDLSKRIGIARKGK